MLFKNQVYFTIQTIAGVGFTDQLYQFSSFYKLGRFLGYTYLHTDFQNKRSHGSIYDFLGVNDYLRRKTKFNNITLKIKRRLFSYQINQIKITLGDQLIESNNITSLDEIKDLVEQSISARVNSNLSRSIIIITFALDKGRKFLRLIHNDLKSLPDQLSLKKIYQKQRLKYPVSPVFIADKFKCLVHIRQGDTGIIQTPWNTFIPLWLGHSLTNLREYDDRDEQLFASVIEPEEYYHFISELFKFLNYDDFSLAVFSDGYQRAFKAIYSRQEELAWNEEKIQQLKVEELTYDQKKFNLFNSFKDAVVRVGETEESLYQLIDAALDANIMIIGNQQRMIAKLIANYYDQTKKQLLVLLEKQEYEYSDFVDSLGLDPDRVTVIKVNINSVTAQTYQEIAQLIQNFDY